MRNALGRPEVPLEYAYVTLADTHKGIPSDPVIIPNLLEQAIPDARFRYAGVPDVEDAIQEALCKLVAPERLARLAVHLDRARRGHEQRQLRHLALLSVQQPEQRLGQDEDRARHQDQGVDDRHHRG